MKLKIPNLFTVIILFSMQSITAQEIIGSWQGDLDIQGNKLHLAFHVTEDEDEILKGTMDIKSQGAVGIPLDVVLYENKQVTLEFKQAGVKYIGTLNGKEITGDFEQAGQKMPLTLTKFENQLPGNTDLPSTKEELAALVNLGEKGDFKYTVEDYFEKPKTSSFQLSPNGKYLSYKEKDENTKNHVYVKDLKTGKITRAIVEGEDLILGYGWVNDERLVYVKDQGGDENYHIYAVNIDGSNEKDLTPFDGVQAQFTELLKDDKDHIIVSLNKNNPQVHEPYKLNIVTGDLIQLYENEDATNPINSYDFDKDGNLKGFAKLRDGVNFDYFYDKGNGNYELVKQLNWKDSFSILYFNYATDNPHDAYVVSNLNSDKSEILLYDLKEDKVIEKIYSNPDYDVSDLALSRHRGYELDYYTYEGVKNEIIPVSKFYKKLHNRITQEFPNYQYSISDYTDDESKWLIYTNSDRLYGKYHLYDAKKDEFELLYDLMPQLKESDMAEMRPITFKSRDGLTIHGYITLPKEAIEGKKVPLIVNPHGGPQGIRDSWGFNPETQLFASRGYATLQVNFRISGGYGREFLESGFKQIGRKAMDDVEDGVQYVVDQGWVDKDKIAIYGASHGGYAVLRGLTKSPDLYACGVDYVGVSNIFTFFDSFPEYWKPYKKIVKEIWYDEDVAEEKKIMEEVSPVFHIDKINKPLFVIQGANDPRVNIDESDQIVSALRAKGFDVPYMVKYDEGHGFGKEENRLELYKAMLGFYAKHLN